MQTPEGLFCRVGGGLTMQQKTGTGPGERSEVEDGHAPQDP